MSQSFKPIFSKVAGQNNTVDQFRIPYSEEEGITALSETKNVIIDDSGGAMVRPGFSSVDTEIWHSVYCDNGPVLGVRGTDLCMLDLATSPVTVILIASGFTKRVSFARVNEDIYYTSGSKQGAIISGVHVSEWPQMEYGRPTDRQLLPAPLGDIIAFHLSRIWLAFENVVVFSEPYGFNLFDLGNSTIIFDSPVTMLRPVAGGIFISTTKKVYFFPGNEPEAFEQRTVSQSGALEGGMAHSLYPLSLFGLEGNGECAIWTALDGVYLGLPDGSTKNLTEQAVVFPPELKESNLQGATGIFDQHIYFSMGV